jgi:hypothetical protein
MQGTKLAGFIPYTQGVLHYFSIRFTEPVVLVTTFALMTLIPSCALREWKRPVASPTITFSSASFSSPERSSWPIRLIVQVI